MVWIWRDPERDKRITDEIDRQEDRAAGIIATAYFEDHLTAAISSQFIQDDEVINPLIKGRGQLSDFGTKIDIAYLLGLINKRQWRRLHIIRRIRNEFAHDLEPLTFSTPKIKDKCKALFDGQDLAELRVILDRAFVSSGYAQYMKSIDGWFTRVSLAQTNPRDAFISAIQLLMVLVHEKSLHGIARLPPSSSQGKSEQQSPPAPQTGHCRPKKRERPQKSSPA